MVSSGGDRPASPWSYFGLGFEIVIPVVLGIYVGYRLDLWLETSPWLMVTGALAGLGLSFYGLFRRVLGQGKEDR
jgi:F0F1-type ATP synthase assembly protein I